MKTRTINIYEFSELSDTAKETALSDFRDDGEFFWWSDWEKSLKEFSDAIGIRTSYAISPYSHSHCNIADHSFEDGQTELSGMRLRTFLLNNYYHILYEKKTYGKYVKRDNEEWTYNRYSKIQYQGTCCPFTGFCGDEDLLDPIKDFIDHPKDITLIELLEECLNFWMKTVISDMEQQDSEEFISEHFDANEYEFDEDGKQV